MKRSFVVIGAILLFLAPAFARAQGLLVVVNPNEHVRLPRPIVIWPQPRPVTQPPTSYAIKDLDVQMKIIDQVAQVQVSQTFVNTGSLPMEVAFVFPLPYDGAVDRMTLMIDGREYPAKLLNAADVRGDRSEEPRSRAVGMARDGLVPHERLSGAAGSEPNGVAALLATVPQGRRADGFHLSAEHGQIHVERCRAGEFPRDDREPGGD